MSLDTLRMSRDRIAGTECYTNSPDKATSATRPPDPRIGMLRTDISTIELSDSRPQPGVTIAGEVADVDRGDNDLITRLADCSAAHAARMTSASRASGEAVGMPRWRASAQNKAA